MDGHSKKNLFLSTFLFTLIFFIVTSSLIIASDIKVINKNGDVEVLYLGSDNYQTLEDDSLDDVLSIKTGDGWIDIDIFQVTTIELKANSMINLNEINIRGKALVKTIGISKVETMHASIFTDQAEYELDTTGSETIIRVHTGSVKIKNNLETYIVEQFNEVNVTRNSISEPFQFKEQNKTYRWAGYLILIVIIIGYLWFKNEKMK
ncbi:MAG: hypothetical protein U9R08_00135 [Nanoarchaeota archaeon]|nr:hypothetical protein [Nanoarchaeota archaeon]